MQGKIIDFQYFLMSVILLSNTNYLYFALYDIKAKNKDHKTFVYKCLMYSIYTMFFSIMHVAKYLIFEVRHLFQDDTFTILMLACAMFLIVTILVYILISKVLKIKVKLLEWNVQVSFVIVLMYTFGVIGNVDLFSIVFWGYALIVSRFIYNIVILKKSNMNYGLYFLATSFLVMLLATLLKQYFPFEMYVTVILALCGLNVYGLFLFYAQFYVEELEESNKSLLTQSSDLLKLNDEMKAMAYKDSLTGLPNEVAYLNFMNHSQRAHLFILINVRNFASFNQILGFHQGNLLLKKMADQLRPFTDNEHHLFKLYNDKFLIVTEDMTQLEAFAFIKQIQVAFSLESIMNFRLEIAVGITSLEADKANGDYAHTIIGALEVANQKAKSNDGGVYFIAMSKYLAEKAQYNLEYHLKNAIANNQIEVYYQPQVDTKTKEIVSYEALARWQLEEQFISPSVFIPLAEQTGLISKLSYQVIESIFFNVHQLKWNKGKKISINLSSIQLMESDFMLIINNLLNKYEINSNEIVFEITETALLYDIKKVEDTIKTIKKFGFEISLDDFGTGYSSLNRFSKLNFDEVKFDRFFVKDLQADEKLRLVFSKTLELFNLFEMRVVVEGVETVEQEQILDTFEIDIYQGYYYARPMSLGQLLSTQIVEKQ
ncbi:MAG: hypothetical protein BGO41_11665 [Clostridiales bacterium 38-18]|nr:MAG: hypothetical protein BGO41_11665 [Clostridiales bacterium 38-18]